LTKRKRKARKQMNEIVIGGKIEYSDYKKFNLYHIKNRYIIKFLLLTIAYIGIIWGLNLVTDVNLINLGYTLLISVVLSAVTILLLLVTFFNRLKKIYYSSSRIQLEQNYIINEQGIKCKNDRGESIVTWEDIIEIIQCNDHIIIYTSLVQAIIIPNKFFKSENEFSETKYIISNKLDKKKIKFKISKRSSNYIA